MTDSFVKFDMHIHTPASKDYKGNRNEDEYLKILENIKKKNIKIAAITDHNSIEGYKNIIRLKEKLIDEKKGLRDKEKKAVERRLKLFDDILILPGIEFEVKPGIHLLVIFNDKTEISQIEDFLIRGGYEKENYGLENPIVTSNWDIIDLFREADKLNTIVIDAHTDSNKGIYNTIRAGTFRARCFSSDSLSGVAYKSDSEKDKLKNIIDLSIEYKRTSPLAYVKFSDSHSLEEIGRNSSWINVADLSFESVKKSFGNPDEKISAEFPDTRKILNKILGRENTFCVPDFSEENNEITKRIICALSNTDGGYILFGISTDKRNRIGINLERKKNDLLFFQNLEPILEEIEDISEIRVSLYDYQISKYIISLYLKKSEYLVGIKDDLLVYDHEKGTIKALSPKETQFLIEERRNIETENKLKSNLEMIESEVDRIKVYFSQLPIIREYERKTRLLGRLVKMDYVDSITLQPDDIKKIKKGGENGVSRGNIIYFRGKFNPRLPYAYLRYSAPIFLLKGLKYNYENEEVIYIVPGGGSFFAKREYPIYYEDSANIIKLKSDRKILKLICAYIKSSINIWYCISKLEEIDLRKRAILDSIRIPTKLIEGNNNDKNKIIDLFDKIIDLEKNILINLNKCKNDEDKIETINKHNSKVTNLAYKLDVELYKILGLSAENIEEIEKCLRLENVFIGKNGNK